jgi:hypothetical protein
MARNALEQLITASVFAREIRTDRQATTFLISYMDSLLARTSEEDATISMLEQITLQYYLTQWRTIALAELEILNTYSVTLKRGYDSLSLLEYAEVLFPPDLGTKVPESLGDIRAAGKCIAFELATAAGFHLHRANESILHKYYDEVSGGKPRLKNRNIGGYLSAMQKNGLGEARLLSTLRDINDLHKNPLVHPEQSLESIDDAIALLDAVHNAAVFMLKVISSPES